MELKSIMTEDWEHCFVCGRERQQVHHVIGGAYRKKSEKFGLIIPICNECHREVHDSPNQELNKKLKANAQADFQMDHTYAEWMKYFDKNYM